MKKLFTIFAFLATFMGANAVNWVDVYKIDYSKNTGFPFYVMGYVPEWVDGVMTDYGSAFRYATQEALDGDGDDKWKDGESSVGTVLTNNGTEYQKVTGANPYWHQYFIADGIQTQLDGHYLVKAMVKASEACTINVNMGWSWSETPASASVDIPEEWTEIEWEYTGIGGSSCNLVAQPATVAATIEWKYVEVYEDQTNVRPITWQEWLTSDGKPVIVESKVQDIPTWMGNAETPWADPNVKFNDQENNYLICAWGKEREVNMNDDGGWDPFPATIEQEEGNGNHYFVVHGKEATTEGDAAAWDNQFWIQSPKEWKSGEQLKIRFRYKASKNVTVATQIHKQNPSDYLIWHAIGDVSFTTEWQDFDGTMTMADDMAGGWSIAFQLNQNDKEAIDFYFDDLSWQSMKLDEGFFVAGCNPDEGLEYDFSNAIEFEYDEDEELYTAVVGEAGAWVSQVMISTVRGNDAAFKSATLKPDLSNGPITNDPDDWKDYTASSLAKVNLPGTGIWKIYIDPNYSAMAFEMLDGKIKEKIEIKPNPTEVVIETIERDFTAGEQEGGTGQPWDNQFWILANRTLSAGESTIVEFDYVADMDAHVTTQDHVAPGAYLHWGAIGDVEFSTEEQHFSTPFVIPSEADGMQSIAFNLSEIKEANKYTIKNVVWMLEDESESLIDQTGTKNFYVKLLGENPHEYGKSGEEPLKGDVNHDGQVDVSDISAIITVMAGFTDNDYEADVNNDGAVDVSDISTVISIMAGWEE